MTKNILIPNEGVVALQHNSVNLKSNYLKCCNKLRKPSQSPWLTRADEWVGVGAICVGNPWESC